MRTYFIFLTLSVSTILATVDDATKKIVEDAVFQALNNVDVAAGKEKSVAEGTIVSSQTANSDSKKLQFTGDVLEEATKILVAKYGLDILPAANEVLSSWAVPDDDSDSDTDTDTSARKKRNSDFGSTLISELRFKRQSSLTSQRGGGEKGKGGRGRGGSGGRRGGSHENHRSDERKGSSSEQNGTGVGGYSNPVSNGTCRGPPKKCSDRTHDRIRSITGLCNNRDTPTLANALTPIRRLIGSVSYADGLNSIRNVSVTGSVLPSTRLISNRILDEGSTPNFSPNVNHFHMQIGQFVAHDVIFMPSSVAKDGSALDCESCDAATSVSPNCAPIPVPADEPYFKPLNGQKTRCIRLTRSLNGQSGFGVRTQIDQNTHYLDMSSVYGSSDCEAESVRSFSNGLLKTYTGMGYVLPPQNSNDSNCQSKNPNYCFTAGDFRNSLHPGLIPVHSTFVKEHNRLAVQVKSARPSMSDEDIYQLVRKIMIGQWQHIVFSEYLPKLLSDKYLTDFDLKPLKPGSGPYQKYNNKKSAALSGEFAAAAFRFGHSQSRSDFMRQDANNKTVGSYDLGYNIFYADQLYQKALGGWETMLNGLLKTAAMVVDRYFSFGIRNQLFEIRGKNGSGVDLISVNIMRGRDVGLQPYANYRSVVGLTPIKTWSDLSSTFTAANLAALKTVYADPADIDLYVGLVMETPLSGGQLGPTASYIIAEQFNALKTGDRFYYENIVPNTAGFTTQQLDAIRRVKFAKILCENTDIITSINPDIFALNGSPVACSTIPDLDINPFLV